MSEDYNTQKEHIAWLNEDREKLAAKIRSLTSERDEARERCRTLEERWRLFNTCAACSGDLRPDSDPPICFDCHTTKDQDADWRDAVAAIESALTPPEGTQP